MSRRRGRPPKNNSEDRTINALARLRAFEKFEESIPIQELKQDLQKGLSSAQLREKWDVYITARQIATALIDQSGAVANAAAEALKNRQEGKPVEKKELTHKLGNLSDDEIDAYLLTKLKDRNMITDGVEDSSDEASEDE